MTGNEYKKLIGRYLVSAFGGRGLKVYDEVSLGTSIIGKQRRTDLLVVAPDGTALAVECKFQDVSGTADEKIPYALDDMEAQRIPGVVAYAGRGFSEGVLHLLQGSAYAAYCLPEATQLKPQPRRSGPVNSGTWQLDHVMAQTFRLWDVVLSGKAPINLEQQLALSESATKNDEPLLEASASGATPTS